MPAMNIELLKLILGYVKNLRNVLSIEISALEPYPHFPRPMQIVFENQKPEILDAILGVPKEIPLDKLTEIVSPDTLKAIGLIREEKFTVNPLADYVGLVWSEALLESDPSHTKALDTKDQILKYWNNVRLPIDMGHG